ncbi:hypothetical protein NK6_3523 [Bradyrhizobium diazoefficiens]|uniref:Uncharacterized protein n=1 Tax=Bradyrhizobium diazoefficiens TaxID=1355477 RepID=A0A0E3VU31_9BRAD|nr:hypothetical protein NK6_3523 [Bradyrhizobium diazoefficiens]
MFLLTEFSADGLFPLVATVAIAAEECGGTFAAAQGSRHCAVASQAKDLRPRILGQGS